MSSELHPPPLDLAAPSTILWPAGKRMYRVHHSAYGATEFNPGVGNGRFHPIQDRGGAHIPTIYGSNTIDGALSETVFHDVPVSGPAKRVAQSSLIPLSLCTLTSQRDLRLIELKGYGLRKIGVTRAGLIEADASHYDKTRRWAESLFDHDEVRADGLIWISRQHDTSEAIVLFGPRVARPTLQVMEAPRSLYPPSTGWLEVLRAAEAADITIEIA